ncbi:MAG: hypothetical protein ACRERE_22875 [Candidatus Entotheonellia bacterium]
MSVSLLMALLPKQETPSYPQAQPDPHDRDLRDEYSAWVGKSEERRALMLQALYEALYGYAKMGTPEGRAVGTLLARAVSKDTTSPPPNPDDIQALRKMLKKELQERFDELKKQFI